MGENVDNIVVGLVRHFTIFVVDRLGRVILNEETRRDDSQLTLGELLLLFDFIP